MDDSTGTLTDRVGDADGGLDSPKWLILTHHLPPEPAYLRVKVGRRLKRIGATALKNSVYVLPRSEEALEDFQWLLQEIQGEGGDATLCDASFLDGQTDARLINQFRAASEAEYEEVTLAARTVLEARMADGAVPDVGAAATAKVRKLSSRLEEAIAVDFFGAAGREAADQAVRQVEVAQRAGGASEISGPARDSGPTRLAESTQPGRTWVTRAGVKVDRIASAWLIRRFIDPEARFVFVNASSHTPAEGEIRFDMFDGEYTHVGEACTFEGLVDAFGLGDEGLTPLAEIVHDLDCKDDKFGRPELPGVASLLDGIIRRYLEDDLRLARGGDVLDDLYAHFLGTA